jgi:uncharacterized protein YqgC (DUF456 family)
MTWEQWAAGGVIVLCSLLGIALTAVTLPGVWIAAGAGAVVALWRPELISWWTVGAAFALAGLAELVEFGASAVGAAKVGGTKAGAMGSIVGTIVGAIVGAPFFFPIGTIVGGVLGAGVGALIAERGIAKRTWHESAKAGSGAAVGRFVATVLKTVIAVAIALTLSLAVFL